MLRRSGAPDARSLRNQPQTQAVRWLAPKAPLMIVKKVLTSR
jgi:hypothetical protein